MTIYVHGVFYNGSKIPRMKEANANQVFAEDEKEMIQSYCAEMQIAPPDSYEKSVEEIVREVNSISDMKSKKIIVLELLGLVLVDKEYDIKEKEFIYQVSIVL